MEKLLHKMHEKLQLKISKIKPSLVKKITAAHSNSKHIWKQLGTEKRV